jgi:hypothetical protein
MGTCKSNDNAAPPAEKKKPETVGPKALERLAVDAAALLMTLSIKREDAKFVRT